MSSVFVTNQPRCGSDPQTAKKAIKRKWREAICSSQLPTQAISTVFLSYYSLHCIRGSHPRDDPRHHLRSWNLLLAPWLCSEKVFAPLAAALTCSQSFKVNICKGKTQNFSLDEFIKCSGQGGKAQISFEENYFPVPIGNTLFSSLNPAQKLMWVGKEGKSTVQQPI